MIRAPRCFAVAIAIALAGAACGGAMEPARQQDGARAGPRALRDRPVLSIVARDGDPVGGVAAAVATGGIAPERGAVVPVALAALVEARLTGRDAEVVPSSDGYRVRLLAPPGSGAPIVDAIRAALLSPVLAPELAAVKKKLDALAHRPLPDPALLDAARCAGEPFGERSSDAGRVTVEELEGWRRVAHGLGRVAVGVAGRLPLADEVSAALARAPAWPAAASAPLGEPWPEATAPAWVYEPGGEVKPGGARATLAFHVAHAARAVAAAPGLADPRGPLASRLRALEAPARVTELTATAHARGGCLALVLDFAPADLGGDAASRVATAIALARQEVTAEMTEVIADDAVGRALTRQAGDPRDAAERAAWWALAADREGISDPAPRTSIAVAFAGRRDAPPRGASSPLAAAEAPARAEADVRAEIARAIDAFRDPVVEAKTRVEAGQSDLWVLLASPCGTYPEVEADAGLGAVIALASATDGAEGWAAADGIGVIAHGAARPGESPLALARRVADSVARRFAAEPLDPGAIAGVRASLLAHAIESVQDRALVAIANAVVPGHPSWFVPAGTSDSLGRSSNAAVVARANALRGGPLRVAVIANVDAGQATAVVRAVDRWVVRRPGESRACAAPATLPPPRAGTYAIDAPGASEAWLALPLPAGQDDARALAGWTAAMLDGADGLLARSLGAAGLARAWSARVVGPAQGGALVVRVAAGQGALDAAVAQTRALLDRMRQGAIAEDDRARAVARRAREDLRASLDPRGRLAALWRSTSRASEPPPTLDRLRAFAAATLHDDALIVVAARASSFAAPAGRAHEGATRRAPEVKAP